MKFSKSLFLAFAGLGLFACSNEDNVPSTDNSHNGTFLTLTLVGTENGGSRTSPGNGSPNTEEGTTGESTITSAMVILTNADGEVQSTTTVENFIKTASGMETYPVEASVGTYYVYVIANPGVTSFTDLVGKNINMVTKTITGTDTDTFADEGKFLMFSECNGNGVDDIKGQEITVSAGNDYDNPARADEPIKLDRLAAKITYATKTDGVNIDAATTQLSVLEGITFNGFALVNGIKDFYLQQHWSAGSTSNHANTLLTPSVTNDDSDDFYNRWADFRTVTGTTGSYTEVSDSKNTSFTTGALYCMENNSGSTATDCFATGADLNGNTTGVIFKATAKLQDKTSDELAGSNCFYAYNGEYFAKLEAVQAKYPAVFDDGNAGTDAVAELAAAKAELQAAKNATADESATVQTISDFRVKYNIHVYENGVMYYTHYIEDQNYTADENGQEAGGNQVHYQSVMRNTIYGLTVNSVKNIGDDIPGGWNPDTDPDDPTTPKTYLVVECKVNPWVLSNYGVDLQ